MGGSRFPVPPGTREKILAHLRARPGLDLTPYEIARAVGLLDAWSRPQRDVATRICRQLAADGLAEQVTGYREYQGRTVTAWRVKTSP